MKATQSLVTFSADNPQQPLNGTWHEWWLPNIKINSFFLKLCLGWFKHDVAQAAAWMPATFIWLELDYSALTRKGGWRGSLKNSITTSHKFQDHIMVKLGCQPASSPMKWIVLRLCEDLLSLKILHEKSMPPMAYPRTMVISALSDVYHTLVISWWMAGLMCTGICPTLSSYEPYQRLWLVHPEEYWKHDLSVVWPIGQ